MNSLYMDEMEERKKGIWGTVLFHAGILAILLHFGVVTPMKAPSEPSSVEVNFGDSETGLGNEEPAGGGNTQTVKQEQKRTQKYSEATSSEENVPASAAKPSVGKKVAVSSKAEPVPAKTREKVLTQNTYDAAAIAQSLKQKKEQEKIERDQALQRQKDYLARKKGEEKEAIKAAERQRFASQSKAMAVNAFGKGSGGGTGEGKTSGHGIGSGTSRSQGVTFPGGNQGIPSGKAGSKNYGRRGGSGKGVSYSLSGRESLELPKPVYPGNEEGVVVVQVTVDQNGIVKKASPGVRGSTTMNSELLGAARRAALRAHFNTDKSAPAFQQGTITYRFVLN